MTMASLPDGGNISKSLELLIQVEQSEPGLTVTRMTDALLILQSHYWGRTRRRKVGLRRRPGTRLRRRLGTRLRRRPGTRLRRKPQFRPPKRRISHCQKRRRKSRSRFCRKPSSPIHQVLLHRRRPRKQIQQYIPKTIAHHHLLSSRRWRIHWFQRSPTMLVTELLISLVMLSTTILVG